MATLIQNAQILDTTTGTVHRNQSFLIEEGKIRALYSDAHGPSTLGEGLERLDAQGMFVMPGLIDAHVHVMAWTADVRQIARYSPYYTAAKAGEIMRDMLMRGFTTVRDVGGADYGIARAVDEDALTGPRVVYGGMALSQTGGHGDMRGPGELNPELFGPQSIFSRLCDGVAEVQRACRDEVRRGAKHIKLMLSGGVASLTDRIENVQFAADELKAAVEEAENAGLYVVAHSYTAKTVNRAIKAGVRSLEHCNLIDEESIDLLLKHNAFMVPTLVTYEMLATEGVAAGLPESVVPKIEIVRENGLHALKMAHEAGVNLAYGTDLLGAMHRHQLKEFGIRAQVQDPLSILQGATVNAAKLMNEVGESGVIKEDARADLLMVKENPLENLQSLESPETNLCLIMKAGRIYKNTLDA
ncbi:MAG: amidohydrolase family protein [Trueperaceae bacterium]|nr:amidohydrolase family protein [Trueperaceae bacterium]